MWTSVLFQQALWGVRQEQRDQTAQQGMVQLCKTNVSLLEKWYFPVILVPSCYRLPADNSVQGLCKVVQCHVSQLCQNRLPKLFLPSMNI